MAVKTPISVTQLYSAVYSAQSDGLDGNASHNAAPILPSIHPAGLRASYTVRRGGGGGGGQSSIPVAKRGGVKVIQQQLGAPFTRFQQDLAAAKTNLLYNRDGSMSPAMAITRYRRIMSEYEKTEIKSYNKIWFIGPTAQKIRGDKTDRNFGYDNDQGRYKVTKNDHIAYRFEILKCLGKGSFGDVMQVYDHQHKECVAIKIIRNEPRFHEQAKEEIKILELLRAKDTNDRHNVVHMKEYFKFRGHLCITFEMCHRDLYVELKEGGFAGFTLDRIKNIARNLVGSLRHLRRNKLIHCDLKPENILLRRPGSDELKIIDFGSSCIVREQIHTYIQSRFYRAPEVILGVSPYGCPIDMWSLGCILVELYTGRPLFPGHSEKEQLLYQIEYLGTPPEALLSQSERRRSFFDGVRLKKTVDRRGRVRTAKARSLKMLIGKSPEHDEFHDFLMGCFEWVPDKRMTPREASRHNFVASADPRHHVYGTPPTDGPGPLRRKSAPPAPPVSPVPLSGGAPTAAKVQRTLSSSDALVHADSDSGKQRPNDVRRQSKIFATEDGSTIAAAAKTTLSMIHETSGLTHA